jgi:nitroreductase
MDVIEAIRTRRTIKAYDRRPIERDVLEELFALASWAPNHHLTEPWRFRVLGPEALAALKQAAGSDSARKLDRAPTLVLASVVQSGDKVQKEEDLLAAGCAIYIVLLAAHARGLAGYWRTPKVLRTKKGRTALGVPEKERVLGLVYLGHGRQGKKPPKRARPSKFVTFLD